MTKSVMSEKDIIPYLDKIFGYLIEEFPSLPEAYLFRGKIRAKQNLFQEAIQDFSRCIALDKDGADAYLERCRSYGALEKFIEAIRDYHEYKVRIDKIGDVVK
jgi:tetratricopeptide (TPR) repeat protein